MRTFTKGSGEDRKFVMIEVAGTRVSVVQGNGTGATKRTERELASEDQARSVSEKMVAEFLARGYVEKGARKSAKPAAAKAAPAASSKAAPARPKPAPAPAAADPDAPNLGYLLEADDGPAAKSGPLLPRLAPAPAAPADGAPKKKKAGGKKTRRKKGGADGDALDKRVVAAVAGVGLLVVGFVGFMAYDAFLKPPSIVGKWAGSRLDYEVGGPMSFAQYDLILDDAGGAAMGTGEGAPSTGTYSFQGDRLVLNLKDDEGEDVKVEYRASLGRATLDLYEPGGDRKVVQLVRAFEKPKAAAARKAAPADIAVGDGDAAADARLASVEFSPKDNAFKIKHPPGWEVETGSRPDNTYSWARFTKGSARIQVFADVTGSLMAGAPNQGDYEEGSEMAPVHSAHTLYKKTISEEYGDYNEGEPKLFKGSGLGEGRIASFTASGGGLFGSKLRGCRVTLLTGDRRITVLCECPEKELDKLQGTFLAVARSVSR